MSGDIITATSTRFYISDDEVASTLQGFRSIDDWVEVGQIESISEFGEETEDFISMPLGRKRVEHLKGERGSVGLNVIVGHDIFDSGQDVFDIAEGVADQFAFKIVIPVSEDASDTIYFQALVRSNKLDVGTNDHVVRRNYTCVINSQIFTEVEASNIFSTSFHGAGNFSVRFRQISSAPTRLPGSGTLAVYARQINLVAARFAGAGGFSIEAAVRGRISISATFAGAGALSPQVTLRGIVDAETRFAGSGSLAALVNQRQRVSASFQGAGSLAASLAAGEKTAATYAGAGGLTALVSVNQKVSATFQGAGAFNSNIIVTKNASVSFQGAGAFRANIVVGAKNASASLQGAGNLSVNAVVVTSFILLRDGVSKLLLRDGVSRLKRGH